MPSPTSLRTCDGENAWTLTTPEVRLHVTQTGGMVGGAEWRGHGRRLSPLHTAPWAGEKTVKPPVLRALRGDFFCLPFGANARAYRGKTIPIHGDTANGKWKLVEIGPRSLRLTLDTAHPQGRVEKTVWVNPGEDCVYQRHVLSGYSGKLCFGHHAMLRFRPEYGVGRVSTSRLIRGQVFPGVFEEPARGGYSSLQPGARFESLSAVPRADGTSADLTRYPAREGYEDLVMVSSLRDEELAWTAVTFPEAGGAGRAGKGGEAGEGGKEGFVWIGLKNPKTLASTILWHSNGGRHYAPWSSRHRHVLGVEEVTANFHYGLAESAAENDVSRDGVPTSIALRAGKPLSVGYVMACVPVPPGFDEVEEVHEAAGGVVLTSRSGKTVGLRADLSVLADG